ncbi:hypothetical protein SBOR_8103 [Sclerotinia borealis F-4128]|uniref:Uncharacterized protein n=1 Tax=Sclerotinia borealis (strain F-4128) TaxID=1432307 RepID=W9C445_SCLBF|nr:hypothetical protein SBOR_8103 [Sclerotinia borealis F-4128]
MPKNTRNAQFQSCTILFRRESYPNLPARAPLPDLVALHRSGKLFANPIGVIDRATTEDIVETYRPTGGNVDMVRKFVEKRFTSFSRHAYKVEQEDEDENQSPVPPYCSDSASITPSSIQHSPTSARYSSLEKSFAPAKLSAKFPRRQLKRKRKRPNLRIVTSPAELAELERRNIRRVLSPNVPIYSHISPNSSAQSLRAQNTDLEPPTSHSPSHSEQTDTHTYKRTRYPADPSNISKRFQTTQTRVHSSPISISYSAISPTISPTHPLSPSPQPPSIIPSSPSPSSPPYVTQPYLTQPYLTLPPTAHSLTPHQYITAIHRLLASTHHPNRYPLPPKIKQKTKTDIKDIEITALRMEWVEDAIRLDGAPLAARDLYYEQFARPGEF